MSGDPQNRSRKSLELQLQRARRALEILQEQRAGYGLRVPVDLVLELEGKEAEVAKLEEKLRHNGSSRQEGKLAMEPLTVAATAFITSLVKGPTEQAYGALVEKLKQSFAERKPEVAEQIEVVVKEGQEPSPELLEAVIAAAKDDAVLMKELNSISGVMQNNPQLQQQVKNVGNQIFGGSVTIEQHFH